MIIYTVMIVLFSFVLSLSFPAIYVKVKQNTIQQLDLLREESNDVGRFPVLAISMFLMPVMLFFLSESMLLSVFCFIFAVVAYTDVSARWVPDFLIYFLLALAMIFVRTTDFTLSFWAVVFYMMPIAMFSAYGFLTKKETWIASGDYYLFPSIGLTLLPEYAAGLMLINLMLVLVISRWVQKVPLITVAYFTFIGYQTCLLSGVI